MNRSELINYYLLPNKSFEVLDVLEGFIRVKLTRLDNPNTAGEYFVKFDTQKLKGVKPGFWYSFDHKGEFVQDQICIQESKI